VVLICGLSAIKLAVQAGSHIYKNRQQTKMLMSDAQMRHAQKMASGEAEYQGKLLEARQSDWKDEFILLLLSAPIVMLAWGSLVRGSVSNGQDEIVFRILLRFTFLVPNDFCWSYCQRLWT